MQGISKSILQALHLESWQRIGLNESNDVDGQGTSGPYHWLGLEFFDFLQNTVAFLSVASNVILASIDLFLFRTEFTN